MKVVLIETVNLVIFLYISAKLCDKVHVSLFNSHINFMQELALTAEMSTKVAGGGGAIFCVSPVYSFVLLLISYH